MMKIEQIYTGCLAMAAYYIESEDEAVIIDPLRETQPYLERLNKNGVKLKYIFETHFHADFVSGHIDLANATGATIVFGPGAQTKYDIHTAVDGEELKVGKLTFKVLHTPGHTLESTSFLLLDEGGKEHAIFTGDTLFIGDVGRPDLAQKAGTITEEDLAGMLYDSLRTKIMTLPNDVIVYPAHGAGSACGKNMSKNTFDSLGNQKETNYALRKNMSKEEFIKEVTAGLAPPPQYFAQNAKMNKEGYEDFDEVLQRGEIGLSPSKVVELVDRYDALILDTRKPQIFKKGFIPRSINIGLDGGFAPWVGALITDLKQPIIIVVEEGRQTEAVTRLSRVGYDNCLGYLKGGIEAWKVADMDLDEVNSMATEDLIAEMKTYENARLIDVRKPGEFLSEHALNAENIPLDFINNNMDKINDKDRYYLYCKSGYRSMIASSILKARGVHNIVDITGGFMKIKETNSIPKSNYVCPTELTDEVMEKAIAEVS